MSADDIVFLVRGRKVDPITPPPAPRPPAPDPALLRPARPPRGDRSRHARYDVEVDALGGAGFLRCREHDLIDLGRRLPSLDGVTCDTYGYALLHYGYHLGLLERLAGLHRDLVAATARDLAQTLGQAVCIVVGAEENDKAVRIEVTEQGPSGRTTHTIALMGTLVAVSP